MNAPSKLSQCRFKAPVSVLLAEDKADNSLIASAMIRRFGGETTVARNGAEAVKAAAEVRFDVVLMDLSMPVLDGIEATRQIRAGDGPNAKTPVIALTAHVSLDIERQCKEVGMSAFLTKPIDAVKLFETLSAFGE